MHRFIFLHQNILLRSGYIFVPPGWVVYGVKCASSRISFLNLSSFDTHNLSLKSKALSLPNPKSFRLLVPTSDLIFCRKESPSFATLIRSLSVGQIVRATILMIVSVGGKLLLDVSFRNPLTIGPA